MVVSPQSLMQEVYRTLEEGKVGLFESPTGTVSSTAAVRGTCLLSPIV